jgi:hypothetical protein
MCELKREPENVNLFYDIQSNFQNKIELPENSGSPLYSFPEHTVT